ncbi:MAG: type II toxin-antitoxin system VapC family toxin [Terracidiphilus sp.]|jgi:PIN domain nuclease of toxin-antitoxin system
MILLDTHAVVWLMISPERVSKAATTAITRSIAEGNRPAVSSATIFEIAYGARRGRILLHVTGSEFLDRLRSAFDLRPITEEIAFAAAAIPERFHGDPLDRIIAATAKVDDLVLLTADSGIRRAGVCKTLW